MFLTVSTNNGYCNCSIRAWRNLALQAGLQNLDTPCTHTMSAPEIRYATAQHVPWQQHGSLQGAVCANNQRSSQS